MCLETRALGELQAIEKTSCMYATVQELQRSFRRAHDFGRIVTGCIDLLLSLIEFAVRR